MNRPLRWILEQAGPPLVLFVFIVGLWQTVVVTLDVPAYLFPRPVRVLSAAHEHGQKLALATGFTAIAAISGFLTSLVIGTSIAFVFAQAAWIRRMVYPYAIFFQTVPIVAIAPLIITWFGTGLQSVIMVAFIISVFPILTSVTAGMILIETGLRELFDLNRASRWQRLWKLQFPHALPFLVTGARTSSGLAVVGAIVGEFFAGFGAEHYGLGYLVQQASAQLKTDLLFAAIIASTGLGITIFAGVNVVGGLLLRGWYEDPAQNRTT